MNKKAYIILFIILFIIMAVPGYFVVQYWYNNTYLPEQIEDPQAYWENNIKSLLLQYGKEHKLEDVDTSQWGIYRNEKYGFEFKIPPGHYVNEDNRDYKNSPYYFSMVMPIDKSSNGCYISIDSSEYEGYYYLLDQLERYKKHIERGDYYLLDYAYTQRNMLFKFNIYSDNNKEGVLDKDHWGAYYYGFNKNDIQIFGSSKCESKAYVSGIVKSFKYIN